MTPLLKSATAAALIGTTLWFGSNASAAPLSASLPLRDALSPTGHTVWWGGDYGYDYYWQRGYAYSSPYYGNYGYAYSSPYYGNYGNYGSGYYGYGYARPYYRSYGYYPYGSYWGY